MLHISSVVSKFNASILEYGAISQVWPKRPRIAQDQKMNPLLFSDGDNLWHYAARTQDLRAIELFRFIESKGVPIKVIEPWLFRKRR